MSQMHLTFVNEAGKAFLTHKRGFPNLQKWDVFHESVCQQGYSIKFTGSDSLNDALQIRREAATSWVNKTNHLHLYLH
ncbi:hypothetical protein [Leptolyngbya sp. FACHB-16]|uniref:hypothetical protein n=1 Tax=Leptolyngbya sp. NM3-A1 TaxID=2933910 RepID=UPI0016875B65